MSGDFYGAYRDSYHYDLSYLRAPGGFPGATEEPWTSGTTTTSNADTSQGRAEACGRH